jgi:tRNA A37 threonylcarbamoyladenosine synthetase subunit TsaC/SUA5/YrdC
LQALLALHTEPLLATTLIAPGATQPLNDAQDILQRFQNQIDAVIDAGACALEPTTIIDLSTDEPTLIRQGRGTLEALGLEALRQ